MHFCILVSLLFNYCSFCLEEMGSIPPVRMILYDCQAIEAESFENFLPKLCCQKGVTIAYNYLMHAKCFESNATGSFPHIVLQILGC